MERRVTRSQTRQAAEEEETQPEGDNSDQYEAGFHTDDGDDEYEDVEDEHDDDEHADDDDDDDDAADDDQDEDDYYVDEEEEDPAHSLFTGQQALIAQILGIFPRASPPEEPPVALDPALQAELATLRDEFRQLLSAQVAASPHGVEALLHRKPCSWQAPMSAESLITPPDACTGASDDLSDSVPVVPRSPPPTLPNNIALRLSQRETMTALGLRMSGAARVDLASRFLPNKRVRNVDEYMSKVFCGQYSDDGTVLVTAAQDSRIRMYDTNSYTVYREISARDMGWSIIDVAFSPDQKFVIYSTWSSSINLVNVTGHSLLHQSLDLQPSGSSHFCPFSISFSRDCREILAGCSDSDVYIYDIEAQQRTLRAVGHTNDVNAAAFADESSNVIFSGSDDGTVKVWDRRELGRARRAKPVGQFIGHNSGITFLDAKGDGRYVISNGKDECIKLWDIRCMAPAGARPPHANHHDYRFDARRAVRRVIPSDTSIMTYTGHRVAYTLIRACFSPAFSTGQKYIVAGSANGTPMIYDVLTGECVQRLVGHRQPVRDVSWHPFEPVIATASWDGTVGLWEHERQGAMEH
ncbi:LEC14B protein [Capsaspora owczarzaki ATCC 30864]|uniref:LEC14B protein n=1 Tax=Capsaspora owczarzaki (strain ATCC 30864) TaxID=595528 RepID=A0A0D2WTI9_CAPO3|nr:LEC14B protein [Capsaspora owczarzaki ATCC 30864]KJE95810.1 LEC14B protein [Capsaspora owczarzaki ATCC 30864]|eukprot:XP_004344971.1 LEC14B protein [Capsaspora owczarzaki ATCC 30864]